MEEHGFRSLLFIPLLKQGRLHGTLGFYGQVGKEVVWSSEFIDMLKTVGNIILNALERKQAVDERENLLAQVREQAKRIQQTIDTVPEGVLLLDANGRVILTNPMAAGDLSFLTDAKVGDAITHLGDRPLADILTSPPKGLWHEVKAGARTFEIIEKMGDICRIF